MRISEIYDRISWDLRIFVGGAFNVMFVRAFLDLVKSDTIISNGTATYPNLLSSHLPQFIVLLVIALIGPLFLSMILTKRYPELKIVPPLYIAFISFAWIIVFGIFPIDNGTWNIVLFGMFLVIVGTLEDRISIAVLGTATERESIYFEHLDVFAKIEDIKTRLRVPEIRKNLSLSDRIDGNDQLGYTFRTSRGVSYMQKVFFG